MRPQVLFPLFAPVNDLPGVGPRVKASIERIAGPHVVDLLWHRPVGIIDRRYAPTLAEAEPGRIATVTVTVEAHQPPPTSRLPYKIRCSDPTGRLDLVFFHARPDYLQRVLPQGETRVVSGRIESYGGRLQMVHPDHVGTRQEIGRLQAVEPVYGLTAGLTLKTVRKAVAAAVERVPALPEWADATLVSRNGWPAWHQAVQALHTPQSEADLAPESPARTRLAYDELLASQLALLVVRARQRRSKGRALGGDGHLADAIEAALTFKLTGSQRHAIAEIFADMASSDRMLRLLQGDVGSGKTVVALMAMVRAVEAGAQAAMMAPTELLARQHFATIEPLAKAAGLRCALLTGRDPAAARRKTLAGIETGDVALAVGTHALFQDDVAFRDLGLAVVDEQHRFGVHQRMSLSKKGRGVDMLIMTATPIPRTLLMGVYGDLDVSRLTEKPAGRRPVDTRAIRLPRLDDVVAGLQRAIAAGERAYWVCPLVEESETSDLAAATERHQHLRAVLGNGVGLLHGRMKPEEKDATMARFAAGDLRVLVATTVVEVGVDVSEATIMVVEHAERFGLAQLHQLRGRVGRNERPSRCLLLYDEASGETARARLRILRETDDGFRIAEEDLRLRGGGEVLGTRQSGLPAFRLADLPAHVELMAAARDDARLALERDPQLDLDRGQALRTLLYLFERDAAIRYLHAG